MGVSQSLGASKLADVIRQQEIKIRQDFYSGLSMRWLIISRDVRFAESFEKLDRASQDQTDVSFSQVENQLMASLEADPVEDGYIHPTEEFLEKLIQDFNHQAGDWLINIFSSDHWSESLKADLLRLLSRQKPLTEGWRLPIIQLGLSSSNIELRDAAAQAAESWEDEGVIPILRAHKEPCAWLADYIACVIKGLNE